MLDNLRAMAVFVSVVRNGSFSAAAKYLDITTSAVSQQIRALEIELGVVLLHRSTRKLSLTEAGETLYKSAKEMVQAAEEARDNVSQLRDGLLGSLRIATTPKLARDHILPALSPWLHKHRDLSLRVFTAHKPIDMIDECVDVAINFVPFNSKDLGVPLARVQQVLLASPDYLAKIDKQAADVADLRTLLKCDYIASNGHSESLSFVGKTRETVKLSARFVTNDSALALSLAADGYGVVCSNMLDSCDMVATGTLVPILVDYELPRLTLHAKTLSKEQQLAKVWRCLEVLTEYFSYMDDT